MPKKPYKIREGKPITIEEAAIAYQTKITEIPIHNIMERDILMKKTVRNIEQLPTTHIQQVNDFVELILQKADDVLITEGLQRLSSSSHTFDFLYNEPELYSVTDLKVKYS